MSLRPFLAAALLIGATSVAAGDGIFSFAPRDGTRFVRSTTRTMRVEYGGMVRTETTIFEAEFVCRRTSGGYRLVMTPVSFRYLVNDHETASPVWGLIQEKKLTLDFNSVGALNGVRGYDEVDKVLTGSGCDYSPQSPAIHLDRFPIGEDERATWSGGVLLWLDQPSRVGTKLEFDSSERGFTGDRVKSHTTMNVLRAESCGAHRCVVTHYTMRPDLSQLRREVEDLIDAGASEEIEQTIEPDTMLPHAIRTTWKSRAERNAAEEENRRWEASLVTSSEFAYDVEK